ncbi:guanylate cyclase soluble subunit beta-2-like [Watersipora subatra]|uniref:guanylate cyclase soluble subunit beta-2-like n=1 Tax=Watersipora subatra TaxID=2589382 RepID=UPI00355BE624
MASRQHSSYKQDVSKEELLRELGEYYVERMVTISEYKEIISNLGINFIEFVNNLDYVHSYIAHQTKLELHLPSLRCVEGLGGSMELFYIAPKCCYNADLAAGIISGISNLVFQSPITCILRQTKTILIHISERRIPMVEATFDLNLQAIKNDLDPLLVPLMLAQTDKNAEKKISRSNVEEVNEEIAHILMTEGPEGHPLRKAARQKARMRWKKLGDVIRGAAFFKYLASRFQPIIPKSVDMNARDFCSLMPFHIMIDKESNIVHAGLALQRQVPDLKNVGQPLSSAVTSAYPADVKLTYDVISSLVNTTFILFGEYHRKDRQSYFKGHFVMLNEPRRLLFVGSPYVRNIQECCNAGLKLSQISSYDATREFILMKTQNGTPRVTGQTTLTVNEQRISGSGSKGITVSSKHDKNEMMRTKEKLAHANAQLDALKNRYKRLYLGLVPLSVVSNLKEQTRLALMPTEMSMLDLTPEEDINEQVFSISHPSRSQNTGSMCRRTGDDTICAIAAKGVIDVERGTTDRLYVYPGEGGNQRSISVDRGRLQKMQSYKNSKDQPLYQPNYIECDGVCIMFCDVVQFTNLKDMDRALRTLTTAHVWLARLCQVFHLEIVESIGDGFLVISHVTGRTKHQAARNMADCALAYLMLNREHFSFLQFRIGIHIGKIYGGVIERSQKTFIVWGSDVEFACKLEAFGLPDKIQISNDFFRFINDGSYNFEEREGVSIKGHDPANYLLLASSKIWSEVDLQEIFGETVGS